MPELTPISVYVHVPFCEQKCAYCDFYTITDATAGTQRSDSWLDACAREANLWMRMGDWDPARPIRSVFFGGGTPSLASPEAIRRFLDELRSACAFAPDVEVSLETQPGTADAAKLSAFADAGVTRFSIGVQTFHEDILSRTGRIHTVADAHAAVSGAAATGRAVGVDLIAALPGHTMENWNQDLDSALSFGIQHVSVYELTWHAGTEFYRALKSGRLRDPGDEFRVDIMNATRDRLIEAGYEHYEISNYARLGYRSAHNLNYWTLGDYVGLGAGAHSFLFPHRYANPNYAAGYLSAVARDELVRKMSDPADPEVFLLENLQMALRLTEGLDLERFGRRFGRDVKSQWACALSHLEEAGLIRWAPPFLVLTREGQLKSDGIVDYLMA